MSSYNLWPYSAKHVSLIHSECYLNIRNHQWVWEALGVSEWAYLISCVYKYVYSVTFDYILIESPMPKVEKGIELWNYLQKKSCWKLGNKNRVDLVWAYVFQYLCKFKCENRYDSLQLYECKVVCKLRNK